MKDVLQYPLGPKPWALANADGTLKKTGTLGKHLEKEVANVDVPSGSCATIVDVMAIVQMIPGENMTFDELSDAILKKIFNDGRGSGRIDVVFDLYQDQSIKAAERINRGSKCGIMFNQIKPGHRIKNWKRILASTESKAKLTIFLAENWKEECRRSKLGSIILMVTTGEQCFKITKDEVTEMTELRSTHEEADTMMIHAKHAAVNFRTVVVISEDTDAMKSGLFRTKIISWIIFTNEELSKFLDLSLEIQYDTRMLLIRRKEPQQESAVTEIYRLSYKNGKSSSIEMLCSAVIDIWSNYQVTEVHGTSWSPEYLMMTGIHFRMTLVEDIPFTIKDPSAKHGYKGFLIDILEIIRSRYNFTYELSEPADKAYGILHNGIWTGMIKELVDKKIDIAWMALVVEATRAKVVDFSTTKIVYTGGKILYKKKLGDEDKFVSPWKAAYTQPFQIEVWLFISATIVFCTVILTFFETYQLKQLDKQNDCTAESKVDCENFFINPFDNLLYMYSALLQQGWDKTPDRISSRVLVIFFRLFCLIMYAGYSAVIISQYIIATPPKPFDNLSDLVANGRYKLGTVNGSAYPRRFKVKCVARPISSGRPNGGLNVHSKYRATVMKGAKIHEANRHEAWELVRKDEDNIVPSLPQMLNRILLHDYAGIYDEYIVDYITSKNCSFQSVDDVFPKRLNTIAFQKNSPYVAAFSSVLTKLQENGIIKRIYVKWFKNQYCAQKAVDEKKTDQESITLEHTTIPFSTVLAGIAAGFVVLILEIISVKYMKKKKCVEVKQRRNVFNSTYKYSIQK
ncbi:Glutamate receptor ionotropic, kainate 2 [Nymphon striatum]|nr:Glutamate receptor ionotropic, kainate 2 [Nymphon striatum]